MPQINASRTIYISAIAEQKINSTIAESETEQVFALIGEIDKTEQKEIIIYLDDVVVMINDIEKKDKTKNAKENFCIDLKQVQKIQQNIIGFAHSHPSDQAELGWSEEDLNYFTKSKKAKTLFLNKVQMLFKNKTKINNECGCIYVRGNSTMTGLTAVSTMFESEAD